MVPQLQCYIWVQLELLLKYFYREGSGHQAYIQLVCYHVPVTFVYKLMKSQMLMAALLLSTLINEPREEEGEFSAVM